MNRTVFKNWVGTLALVATPAALATVLVLGTVACDISHAPAVGSERPNILLIVWDTVRADRLSLYGYPLSTSPELEEFAREAMVYERAISPGNWTVPSHASIFTGLPVSAHGAVTPGKWLDERYETLAESLKSAQYDTYAFTANPHASEKSNLLQGFDQVDHA